MDVVAAADGDAHTSSLTSTIQRLQTQMEARSAVLRKGRETSIEECQR